MNLQGSNSLFHKIYERLAMLLWPALFLLGSCSSDTTNISSSTFATDDEVQVFFVDTFTINTEVMLRDSVTSSSASNLLVGKINDAEVGAVECQTYFQVLLNNNNITIDENAIFDSALLILQPSYHFGEPSGSIRMGVHRLKEEIRDTTYYVWDQLDYYAIIFKIS